MKQTKQNKNKLHSPSQAALPRANMIIPDLALGSKPIILAACQKKDQNTFWAIRHSVFCQEILVLFLLVQIPDPLAWLHFPAHAGPAPFFTGCSETTHRPSGSHRGVQHRPPRISSAQRSQPPFSKEDPSQWGHAFEWRASQRFPFALGSLSFMLHPPNFGICFP